MSMPRTQSLPLLWLLLALALLLSGCHRWLLPLGLSYVWLYDARRGQALYYAHLDSQIVQAGVQVDVGDTLGLVGNTGNARSTSPHLHFGIYRHGEGALDPLPFIDTRRRTRPRATEER